MLSNGKYLQVAEVPNFVTAFDVITDPNTYSTDFYAVQSGGTNPLVEVKIPERQKFEDYAAYQFSGSCADMI